MRKSHRTIIIAVLTALLVIVATTTTASATTSSVLSPPRAMASAAGHWCVKQKTRALASQVPVWIYMEIKDHHQNVVPGVALALLPYEGVRYLGIHGGVWSGCFAVQLFPKAHVPTRYCIALHLGIQAPDGNCKPVSVSPTGQRVVYYSLVTQ